MTNNAEIALQSLMNGNPITHFNEKYVLSDDMRICKLKRVDGLDTLEEAKITLADFIKMSQEIPRDTLIISSLPR